MPQKKQNDKNSFDIFFFFVLIIVDDKFFGTYKTLIRTPIGHICLQFHEIM